MGSRSTPAPTTTTQTSEPPAFAKPGLEFAAEQALAQAQGPAPTFFPGSTVTPFAPETEEALGLITERARAGSPLVSGAQEQALQTIQGRGVNPFLGGAVAAANAPLFERFSQETLPGIRSSFAGIGRSGSGAEEGALQRAIASFGRGTAEQASKLAFGSAEAEAARQQAALQFAPGLAAQDFAGAERLAGVGGARESQSTAQLQEQIDRFNFGQNIEQARINDLISQLTGATGGFGSVSRITPQARPPGRLQTAIGGGLSGAAAGSSFGPQGAGIGAALGALGGLL